MKREDQILVEILADFVNGRSVRCLPDVSLEALYETAQKHNVAGIAAAMLLPLAWVKRWRIGLANRWKIRAAFRGIDRSGSLEEAKMQYRLLKKIGL